ncbi:MAG: LamG domain-containing protein, partial [Planctomycetota bacterium]
IDGGFKKMNGFTCGFELMVAPAQSRASKPDPAHGSDNACPGVILSWEPGQYADTHDVYFGTGFEDVNSATTATAGIYQGNQEANEFDTTPLSLQLGRTYYWRIDVVNDACDPYLWPGSVWSFTTNDGKAFDPNPSDGYARLFPGEALNWSPGCQATSHDVYVGTDSTAVNAATPGVHPGVEYDNVASPTYTPSLDPFKTYYWRVDEVNGGTYKGDIWTFKSGLGGLIMYYRFDGTQGNDLPPAVTDDSGNSITFTKYTSGGGSVKYGESNPMIVDSTASADFDPCSGLFRLDTGEHDMLRLDGKEYTIEMWVRPEVLTQEHDDIMLIGKRGGYSWEVTIEDPEPGSNRSYNCMHGGKGLYMPDNTAMEGEWAHVAMVFDRYTGDSNNLRLYLNGTVKDAERFENQNPPDSNMATIGMEETDGPGYTGFMNGLIDEIRIHDIALAPGEFLLRPGPEYAGFPSPEDGQWDVDPNLVLGWDAGSEATSHDVYLGTSHDDVLNATTDTAGIYLGNVSVSNYPESGLLELEKGRIYYWRVDEVDGGVYKGLVWSFETVTSIFDPNLRAWYKLDEDSGYTARDSSGRRFDAPVDTGDPDWDPADGRFGGSLGFDDDTDVECPDDVLETIEDKISISVWLKDAWRGQGATNWVYSTYGERNGCIVQAAVVEGRTNNVIWRAGDDSMDVLEWKLSNASTLEDWHQWVFVKDEAADTMSIYFDTILVKSKDTEEDDVNDTLVNIKRRASRLGAAEDGVNDFEGRMDDFRLYDKALSDTEIEELFRGDDLELAWAPEPYDGQAEVPRDANLAWRPGKYAVEHDVYLSSDFNDVNDATTASALVYKGRQDACEYDPPADLVLDSTYYWRIDEVNDPCLWKGKVWKFTVANYVIIDSFEQYDIDTNRIYYT